MTATSNDVSARGMLDRLLQATVDGTLRQNMDWYAADAVHEIPFAIPPLPSRIEGRDAIKAFMDASAQRAVIDYEGIRDLRVHETTDPGVLFAEYTAYGKVTESGKPSELANAMVLIVRDGQIKTTRGYFSPAALAALLQD